VSRSGWDYHDRGRWTFGPVFVNYVRDTPLSPPRVTSWGIKIGRWSWNSRTRRQSVDLPGPVSWRSR